MEVETNEVLCGQRCTRYRTFSIFLNVWDNLTYFGIGMVMVMVMVMEVMVMEMIANEGLGISYAPITKPMQKHFSHNHPRGHHHYPQSNASSILPSPSPSHHYDNRYHHHHQHQYHLHNHHTCAVTIPTLPYNISKTVPSGVITGSLKGERDKAQ